MTVSGGTSRGHDRCTDNRALGGPRGEISVRTDIADKALGWRQGLSCALKDRGRCCQRAELAKRSRVKCIESSTPTS